MAEHSIAPWSDAEVERARKMWVAGSSAGDIAASLGRTRTSVIGKVHRLGLQRSKAAAQESHRVAGATQRLPWKAEEVDILRKLASEKRPLSYIGRHLSRSKSAIHRKMVDLGLTVPEPQGQGAALKFGTPASPVPTAPSLPAARTVPAAAIPWEQRTGRECSFPFGDAQDGSLRCCPDRTCLAIPTARRMPQNPGCTHTARSPSSAGGPMSGPNPFRADPEACAISRQTASERRRRAALAAARAHRPNDAAERQAIQEATARYAAAHGAYELHGLLCLEAARYAPEVGSPAREARSEAERIFAREGPP